MREVLPARAQYGRVRRPEQLDDPLARLRAEKTDAPGEAERIYSALQGLAIRPLAGDEQLDAVRARDRLDGSLERLLRRQSPRERERRPVHAEAPA